MNLASVNKNVNVAVVADVRMKITKKSKLSEILKYKPEAAQILFEAGMGCCGCPMAMQETLEDGCKAHGMSEKEIKELVKKLNSE